MSLETKKAKNKLFEDFEIVQTAFSGFPDRLKKEYLLRIDVFSSNSCLFAIQTDLPKTAACPVANFMCSKGGSVIPGNETLPFSGAKLVCSHQKAHLSKFPTFDFPSKILGTEQSLVLIMKLSFVWLIR